MFAGTFLSVFIMTHGITLTISEDKAILVNVKYEDAAGTPMSFASVKLLSPSGKEIHGETDENGNFLFYPSEEGRWKIEVDDGLGHGVVKEIEIEKGKKVQSEKGLSQYQKILSGIGYILGIFGIISYILMIRERLKKDAHT